MLLSILLGMCCLCPPFFCLQIRAAVMFLRKEGFVHGTITPSKIFISNHHRVVLTDLRWATYMGNGQPGTNTKPSSYVQPVDSQPRSPKKEPTKAVDDDFRPFTEFCRFTETIDFPQLAILSNQVARKFDVEPLDANSLRKATTGLSRQASTPFDVDVDYVDYCAPEQRGVKPRIHRNSDFYSIGCIAFELAQIATTPQKETPPKPLRFALPRGDRPTLDEPRFVDWRAIVCRSTAERPCDRVLGDRVSVSTQSQARSKVTTHAGVEQVEQSRLVVRENKSTKSVDWTKRVRR